MIPADDVAVRYLDRSKDKLAAYRYPYVSNPSSSLHEMMDKMKQKQIAKSVGLNVVKGWTAEWKDGGYDIPEVVEYPCYCKPQEFVPERKALSGMCRDRDELASLLSQCSSHPLMIIEQYVEIEKEYDCIGLATEGGSILFGLVDGIMMDDGVTAIGRLMHCEPSLRQKLESFVNSTSYVGMFGIDLMKSGDQIYFSEMNLRLPNCGIGYVLAGVNVPMMYVEAAMNGALPERKEFDELTFCDERVVIRPYLKGTMSRSEYNEILRTVDLRFWQNDEDPEPYRIFRRQARIQKLKNVVRPFIPWK